MTWNPLSWLPFTRNGRQTLIYLTLAGCGPALSYMVWHILDVVEKFPGAGAEQRLSSYVELAQYVFWSLVIIVMALAAFVSIRALKISKNGFEMDAQDREGETIHDGDSVTVTKDA